jgi:S-DNA-T family DNA segregation ATPase FtsK/SpoIIIE
MPSAVTRSSVPRTGPPSALLVGVGGAELEPVTIDLPPGSAVLVAGPLHSGRSTTVLGLFAALVEADPGVRCTVVAPRPSSLRGLLGHPNVSAVVTDTNALGDLLESLVPSADERTVLVVDDVESLANAYGVAERLDELVRRAGESGARLVVAARVNDLPGIYDPWIRYLVSLRRVVLLQPTADDMFLFGAKLPVVPAPGTPGRGVLIDGHRTTIVQVAQTDLDALASEPS